MIFIVIINFLASELLGFMIWSTMLCGLKSNPINFVRKQTKGIYVLFSLMKVEENHNESISSPKHKVLNVGVITIVEGLITCFQREKEEAFFYNVFFTTLKFVNVGFHKKNPSIIFNLFCKLLMFCKLLIKIQLGENIIKKTKGAIGQSPFQRLLLIYVTHVLVYNFKFFIFHNHIKRNLVLCNHSIWEYMSLIVICNYVLSILQ